MKVKEKRKSTAQAQKALQRAAIGVLGQAVRDQEPIPIWDGKKVVWKIPKKEFQQLNREYREKTQNTDDKHRDY